MLKWQFSKLYLCSTYSWQSRLHLPISSVENDDKKVLNGTYIPACEDHLILGDIFGEMVHIVNSLKGYHFTGINACKIDN